MYCIVTYRFYSLDIKENTLVSILKDPIGSFRSFRSLRGQFVSLMTRSPVTHVVVSVDFGEGPIHCNWSSVKGIQWTHREPRLAPDYVVVEEGDITPELIDPVLPYGEKDPWYKILWWYWTGYPRNTCSCSIVVHRIRALMGKETKGRSPGGIYRELRQTVHQSRPSGSPDPRVLRSERDISRSTR